MSLGANRYWRVRWDPITFKCMGFAGGTIFTPRDVLGIEPMLYPDYRQQKIGFSWSRDGLPKPDFPFVGLPGLLIVKPEAWACFASLTLPRMEVLPATCGRDNLLIVGCLDEVFGFDFARSTYKTFSDSTEIMNITGLKLASGFTSTFDLIRLRERGAARFELVVSDRFRCTYESHGLSGLMFRETW